MGNIIAKERGENEIERAKSAIFFISPNARANDIISICQAKSVTSVDVYREIRPSRRRLNIWLYI